MPDLNLLTNKLKGVKMTGVDKGQAFCPAHDDLKEQSLGFRRGSNGTLLLNCYAGCETADVLEMIGLKFKDLFPPR
jgi:hypothetical protein